MLIHFSLQQRAQYFDPVLFPVRRATVVRTDIEGDIHLVTFTVGSYVSLLDAPAPDRYAEKPREYRQHLDDNGIAVPYESSATWPIEA